MLFTLPDDLQTTRLMGVWGRRPKTPPAPQHQLPLGEAGRPNWGRRPKTPARNTRWVGCFNPEVHPTWTAPILSILYRRYHNSGSRTINQFTSSSPVVEGGCKYGWSLRCFCPELKFSFCVMCLSFLMSLIGTFSWSPNGVDSIKIIIWRFCCVFSVFLKVLEKVDSVSVMRALKSTRACYGKIRTYFELLFFGCFCLVRRHVLHLFCQNVLFCSIKWHKFDFLSLKKHSLDNNRCVYFVKKMTRLDRDTWVNSTF